MTVTAPPRPPEVVPAAHRSTPRRRHPVATAVAFVVAVSLLVSGAVFALVAASGTDGAGDPVEAAHEFLDAFAHNDAIGMIESLPPAEREAMRDGIPAIADELQRLGVVSPLSLSSIPGATIEFRKVGFHVTNVFGEVGRVQLTAGDVVITPNPNGFPIPERTRQLLDRDFHATVDASTGVRVIDLTAWKPSLVAIKDGGGWHTSLFYTLAEAIRGDANGPMPRFNDGPMPTGSDNPTKAVRDLFQAAVNVDPTLAVTVAYPPEARALYDYSTLFLPEARRRSQAIVADEPFSLTLKQLDLEASGEGGIRQVRVVRVDARIADGDDRRHLVYRDGCLTDERRHGLETDPQEVFQTCDGTLGRPPAPPVDGDGSRLDKVTAWQGLGRAFPTFVVEERSGRWYVSPTRTVLTTVQEILHRMQPGDVDAFAARLGTLWQLYGLPAPTGDAAAAPAPAGP